MYHKQLSLFEKVILANSVLLIGEAVAGLWVTSHTLEAHHYLIDTSFLVLTTLLSLLVNILLLRASFRPLFRLLDTIRLVSAGKTNIRATDVVSDSEIGELAHAFNSMLDRLEAARREQAILILQAQEEERRRVARELHDESSQNLTALLIQTEIMSQRLQTMSDGVITTDERAQLFADLEHLTYLCHSTLETVRTIAQQLRPSVLDDLGFSAALRWLAEDSRQRLQILVELHVDDAIDSTPAQRYPALYETTMFRIAQESLTNVARHAHAQHVSISLTQDQHTLSLQVCDDGCGYDQREQQRGLGIIGMRERADLLGGNVLITSQPGKGTTVDLRIPLPAFAEAADD